MKTKLEMAHEIAVAMQSQEPITDMKLLSALAWQYADAMQAEADKREPSGFPDVLRGACGEVVAVRVDDKEWQPDWSQAPEWANWWTITKYGQGHWFLSEPKVIDESWVRATRECKQAPTFGYTGDWRNSLRKRPQ